ncbi:hypothetical protein [Flammeovirga sp. EKP202]|uniref:hypothetical protein n=1 Tax=Flammeovirga sp. EKP202 TaxID=2770592 RepID=UPI00165FF875|nr:hypothetical protein [Flammeovirga sp. EKP202]MBD0404326.1 hypothetical protein [Flammeovirga sp. EKP202]
MRKIFLPTIIAFLTVVLTLSSTFAQTENEMKEIITKMVEKNKKGYNKENVEQLMQYLHPDLTIKVTRTSVDGKRRHFSMGKEGYKTALNNQLEQNVHRESDLEIFSTKMQGNLGVCTFALKYNLISDDNRRVLSKGSEFITATFVAQKGKWSILEFNVTVLEEEQFQGKCTCEVYSNPNTGSVITRVTAPKGNRFESENNSLHSKSKDGESYFTIKGVTFIWYNKKEVWTVDSAYKRVEMLAKAQSKEEAMKALVMYIYKDECSEMKMIF